MTKLISALVVAGLFAANLALAQAPAGGAAPAPKAPAVAPAAATAHSASNCESKAVGKSGKPLSGAAKDSFMKKCEGGEAKMGPCESKAIDKNGKPLVGAAKSSFMKKCHAEAKAAK